MYAPENECAGCPYIDLLRKRIALNKHLLSGLRAHVDYFDQRTANDQAMLKRISRETGLPLSEVKTDTQALGATTEQPIPGRGIDVDKMRAEIAKLEFAIVNDSGLQEDTPIMCMDGVRREMAIDPENNFSGRETCTAAETMGCSEQEYARTI